MRMKQTLLTLALAVMATIGVSVATVSPSYAAECGGVKTSILQCAQTGKGNSAKETGVWGILLIVLNILTAGIGIVAVGGITYAAILYASSSDNAEQTKQAKQIIKNVVIGLIAYGGMYLLLNFLVPGGIFT